MRSETSQFIADRQSHASQTLQVVNVELVQGGKPNDCSNNAIDLAETDEESGIRPITGWLVHPIHPTHGVVEIIAHWWNCDKSGKHFDVTPALINNAEYVVDLDLYFFAYENYDAIASIVASSLKFKDGKYTACEAVAGSLVHRERAIQSLSNRELFGI